MKTRPELWLGHFEHGGADVWFIITSEDEANTRARAGQDVLFIVGTEAYRPAPRPTSSEVPK